MRTDILSETTRTQTSSNKQTGMDSFTAQSFFALAENCPDIICRFDRQYYHRYVNPAIEKITGISPSTFIGKDTSHVGMSPEFAQFWNTKIQLVFDSEEPLMFDFDFPTPEGMKYFQSSVVPEFDHVGRVQTVLSISRDITQIRESEQEKEAFVAMVTHELKTPITSIKAFAQLLERKLKKEGNHDHTVYLTKITTQINKLNKQIGDLLEATRIGAGKLQFNESLFSFNELLAEVVDDVRKTTKTHPLLLNKTVPLKLMGDKDRIAQVLLNLLSNAIKYSPDSLPVTISMYVAENTLTCMIHDEGKGIPKEKQSKLFRQYSRLTNETHKDSPGLGLGLYISAEIIKQEGGTIWVESGEGDGTTFCFTLPIRDKTYS